MTMKNKHIDNRQARIYTIDPTLGAPDPLRHGTYQKSKIRVHHLEYAATLLTRQAQGQWFDLHSRGPRDLRPAFSQQKGGMQAGGETRPSRLALYGGVDSTCIGRLESLATSLSVAG